MISLGSCGRRRRRARERISDAKNGPIKYPKTTRSSPIDPFDRAPPKTRPPPASGRVHATPLPALSGHRLHRVRGTGREPLPRARNAARDGTHARDRLVRPQARPAKPCAAHRKCLLCARGSSVSRHQASMKSWAANPEAIDGLGGTGGLTMLAESRVDRPSPARRRAPGKSRSQHGRPAPCRLQERLQEETSSPSPEPVAVEDARGALTRAGESPRRRPAAAGGAPWLARATPRSPARTPLKPRSPAT